MTTQTTETTRTTTEETAAPAAARAEPTRRARTLGYGPRTRKALLLTHIVASGGWLGLDVAMGALVVAVVASDDPQNQAAAAQALRFVTVWPMFTLAVVSLLTGVLLGLGSRYGLVRYWWVLVKLVLNLVLATLILLALRGGVAELAEQGRALALGAVAPLELGDMVFPPVVSTSALLVAMVLSVFKPWGRTGKRPRR
jgi:hypothetical protein